MNLARGCAIALAALALGGCSLLGGRFGDLQTAPRVDLDRYMGHWRVVAHIPYFAEDGCVDSIESYARRPDGDIDNWFSCRKGAGAPLQRQATALAHVVNTTSNAEWNVRFFHVLNIKYVVLAVDPDYRWAIVAHPSRQYGWIFAREGSLPDEATYQKLLAIVAARGLDPQRFAKVPQSAQALDPPAFP